MGVVYEALQEKLARTVALKLIRPEHLYFPRARERFRRETESVARLQHPGIVSIYTVGEERGIPYFAMELIRGATLADVLTMLETRAPESLRGGDLRQAVHGGAAFEASEDTEDARLIFDSSWTNACVRIVARIAEALSHAHARGVLHRDIKPSNITVTPEGRVVLLDFGLASTSVDVRMTTYGTAVGSALYMAPEQIEGRIDEVDGRTDVYALGVTLCELLTLQVPYSGRTADEVKAAIRGGATPHLRTRNHRISRDLENVCLKAIDGERGRRYASMTAFVEDLQRVLAGEPVTARPPGTVSRVARWVARHPTGTVALVLGGILVFGVPTVMYFVQRAHGRTLEGLLASEQAARLAADASRRSADAERERAELEARDSEAVTKFLVDIFGAANPSLVDGQPPTAEELLRQGIARIDSELGDQPLLRARLLERMAESFSGLGSYERAAQLAERAVVLRRELHGDDDVRTAGALALAGAARRLEGASDQGVPQLSEALRVYECRIGPEAMLAIGTRMQLAASLVTLNHVQRARLVLDEALQLQAVHHPDDDGLRLRILSGAAFIRMVETRWSELESVCLEFLRIGFERSAPAVEMLQVQSFYVVALRELGHAELALALGEECQATAEAIYGADSAKVAPYIESVAQCLDHLGRLDEARTELQRAFAINRALHGSAHPNSLRSVKKLCELELRMGDRIAALRRVDEHLAALRLELGLDHIRSQYLEWRAADARLRCGEFRDALERLRDVRALAVSGDSTVGPRVTAEIALCMWLLGDVDEAHELAYGEGGPAPLVETLALVIAGIALQRGELDEAVAVLEPVLDAPTDRFTEEWALHACRFVLALARQRLSDTQATASAFSSARAEYERACGASDGVYLALLDLYGVR